MGANFYTQQQSVINGHGVWHYLITSPIGNFHIVEYESKDMTIKRRIIEEDNDKAERVYNSVCKAILNGTQFNKEV